MKLAAILLSATLAGTAMLSASAGARLNFQDKAESKGGKSAAKEVKMQGHVVRLYADTKIIDLSGGASGQAQSVRKIAYDDSTLWTNMGKEGKKDDVKEGSFVIVLGHMQKDGSLLATRIDLRKPR